VFISAAACSVSPASLSPGAFLGVSCPPGGPQCPAPLVCVGGTCREQGGNSGSSSAPSSGSTGAGSSGSSSSSSTGGTGGSGSSSSGGTSSSGSTGGTTSSSTGGTGSSSGVVLCAPPPDSGWPLTCSDTYILASGKPIGDFSIVPIDGGYLYGIVPAVQALLYGGTFVTLALQPDGGFSEGETAAAALAISSLSLAPPVAANPAAVIAGSYDPGGNPTVYDEIACASPFDGDAGAPFSFFYGSVEDTAEVDKIRFAVDPDGTLGFVAADMAHQAVGWGVGPAGGGCPSSAAALPALPGGVVGNWAPSDSAIAPLGSGQFAIAEVYTSDQQNDILSLFSVPSGTNLGIQRFGTDVDPHVAVSSDGSRLSVLVSDTGAGVLLYVYDPTAGTLDLVTTLSTTGSASLSVASCGSDCILAAWLEVSPAANGNSSFVPKYAVVNGEGCGVVQAFPPVVGQPPTPIAVAGLPENAVFGFGLDTGANGQLTDGQLLVTFCAP
jgi:hypothetical protein